MQAKSAFMRYFLLIVSTFVLLVGCNIEWEPVDAPGNSENSRIEQEANAEEEDIYEVEVESLSEDSPTPEINDSDGEYDVEVEIINEDELAADESGQESDKARSLDDGELAGEEDGILREGKHVIYVGDQAILDAFADRRSDVLVEGSAIVQRTLSDDNDGSRHQRFILRLEEGHTVLVAHNIDISAKIPLQEGDWVDYRGEYEWTEQGGVIHWTHHDPQGQHLDGWLFHDGEFYD